MCVYIPVTMDCVCLYSSNYGLCDFQCLYISVTMDYVNLGGLDPRKQELLEARFHGRVCTPS